MLNSSFQARVGLVVKASEPSFVEALDAAVDYRGDVTVILSNGSSIEGYLFSRTKDRLDLFPKNSPRAISVKTSEIDSVSFSGEDTASGKTWEDWANKKESEKAVIRAAPIETQL